MNKQISWSQISQNYNGYWVELIDFEWDWSSAYPSKARIRNRSTDRSSLMSMIRAQGEHENSVIIFVGNSRSTLSASTDIQMPHVMI